MTIVHAIRVTIPATGVEVGTTSLGINLLLNPWMASLLGGKGGGAQGEAEDKEKVPESGVGHLSLMKSRRRGARRS